LWDRVSFGAGLDIRYVSARLSQAIDFGLAAQLPLSQFFAALPPFLVGSTRAAYFKAGFFPGTLDGVSEVSGNNWSVGFTLGALIEYCKGDDQSFFKMAALESVIGQASITQSKVVPSFVTCPRSPRLVRRCSFRCQPFSRMFSSTRTQPLGLISQRFFT